MTFDWAEWLNLALRWLHLTTGIAWIGSSFYFIWLDNHLVPPKSGEASGELWSVHGGGFYHKQKYQVAPAQMPADRGQLSGRPGKTGSQHRGGHRRGAGRAGSGLAGL